MASSLSQICILCSTLTMSSFPLEIEKNIQAMKISRFFTVVENPRWLPGFSFTQISPLLWSFSCFWSSFIEIEVLNEEEYSILRILYCYGLQQLQATDATTTIYYFQCNTYSTYLQCAILTLLTILCSTYNATLSVLSYNIRYLRY